MPRTRLRIQLRPDLDQDLGPVAGAQQVIDGGQVVAELNVDDAAADRQHGASILFRHGFRPSVHEGAGEVKGCAERTI